MTLFMARVQCSNGEPWVLVFMRVFWDLYIQWCFGGWFVST